MKRITSRSILLVLIWAIALPALAQTTIYSPYSRYGIGDLTRNSHGYFMAMGGLTLPDTDPSHINYANPASYAWADSLSYVFETGVNTLGVNISSADQKSGSSNYTSLNGLQMAFPVTPWWGSSIGLLPYSGMGYRLALDEELDTIVFEGSGGLNRFYFGNAFKPMPNLSLGANATYVFGSLNKTQLVNFDSINYFDIKHNQTTIVGDLMLDFGVQYRILLSEGDPEENDDDLWMNFGLVFGTSTSLRAREDILTQRVLVSTSGYEYVKDTVQLVEGQSSELRIPMKYGGGVALRYGSRWTIGMQYLAQDWSDFSFNGIKDSLGTSTEMNLGIQFLPDASGSGYFGKIRYRVGARYHQTYLNLRGQQLTEYGISFGLGLPLRGSKTTINLAAELGKRGTTENDLLLENYGRVTLGVSVFEDWFRKPKYL